jgi:hypothetical protein
MFNDIILLDAVPVKKFSDTYNFLSKWSEIQNIQELMDHETNMINRMSSNL